LPKGFVHANRRYHSKATPEKSGLERGTTELDEDNTQDTPRNINRTERDHDPDHTAADTFAKELGDQGRSANETDISGELQDDAYFHNDNITGTEGTALVNEFVGKRCSIQTV
jgi:hypothetical protein